MTVTGFHFSDSMVDYQRGGIPASLAPAHRKPLPAAPQIPINQYQTDQQIQHSSQQTYPLRRSPNHSPQYSKAQQVASSSHSHTRTISSSIFPNPTSTPSPPHSSNPNRRFSSQTSSTNGFSSTQPNPTMTPTHYQHHIHRSGTNNSTNSNAPRRSTSSRSSTLLAPTSYVALMRKQKATVWCDRSQTLDPRTAAAQKAAKHRAALEVHGATSGRTSTIASGKVRSTKAGAYVPANLSGVSVPVRLSANEMLGDEEETRSIGGDAASATARIHNRSGSGRSSVHSGKYPSGYPRSNQASGAAGRFSTSSTPPSGNEGAGSPEANIPEVSEGPYTNHHHRQQPEKDYFATSISGGSGTKSVGTPSSGGTGASGEEDRFGEAGELRGPSSQSAVAIAAEQAKKAEELRRRGSVDERTMTMGGKGRLFVANPD